MSASRAAGPPRDGPDADELFAAALNAPRPVDRSAEPVDLSAGGFALVCGCGQDWAHPGRCARCGAPNGRLICGLANNHRGQHQAIALWG